MQPERGIQRLGCITAAFRLFHVGLRLYQWNRPFLNDPKWSHRRNSRGTHSLSPPADPQSALCGLQEGGLNTADQVTSAYKSAEERAGRDCTKTRFSVPLAQLGDFVWVSDPQTFVLRPNMAVSLLDFFGTPSFGWCWVEIARKVGHGRLARGLRTPRRARGCRRPRRTRRRRR